MRTFAEKRDFALHGKAVTPAVSATRSAGHSILELQRAIGNRAVGELLRAPRQKCPACQYEEAEHTHERPREGDTECFPEADAAPQEIKGTPAAIGASANSIVCKGETLAVQNNNTEADSSCTQAHENNHIADWKWRYGNNLCKGVADGNLPLGGPGYTAFLNGSECRAYKVGKTCRENLLKGAKDSDKAAIQRGIDRDKTQIAHYC